MSISLAKPFRRLWALVTGKPWPPRRARVARVCFTCRHYAGNQDGGECRLRPPELVTGATPDHDRTAWPIVYAEDSCGAWAGSPGGHNESEG